MMFSGKSGGHSRGAGTVNGLNSGSSYGPGLGGSFASAYPSTSNGKANIDYYAQIREHWKDVSEFRGIKVYRREDLFDINLISEWRVKGVVKRGNNLQRMSDGLAPKGIDGKSIELHCMTQRNHSAIAKVTKSFHKSNSYVIHINPSSIPSGINRNQFNAWKKKYWTHRAKEYKMAKINKPKQ